MKYLRIFTPVILALVMVILALVAVSLLDILLASLYTRFYSNLAFIVTFGVGGVFGAVLGYSVGIRQAVPRRESSRWILVVTLVLVGLAFFFLLSRIEGGEYASAFRSFGLMLALTSLLFTRGSIEI